jgi:plasmid stabilization system protein ParE
LIPEIFPRAEADIIRQFRYYLVDKGDSAAAFQFPEAVKESLDRLAQYPRIGSLIWWFDSRPPIMASEKLRNDPDLLR